MNFGQDNPDGRVDIWKVYGKMEQEIIELIRKIKILFLTKK